MLLPHLGQTRSARRSDHLLQTPDTFVRTPLPGIERGLVIVHVNPALGAAFTQYTAELDAGGLLRKTAAQRFVYVLDGAIAIGQTRLVAGGYAFIPHAGDSEIKADVVSRLAVIEKPYQSLESGNAPTFFIGRESSVRAEPLARDDFVAVQNLIPDDPAHDFAVNIMTYQPGASLSMVEIHVMEHGLLMLEGGGIYRLSDAWYPVAAGDFIWMAAYCPQWFGALGRSPSKYLIYKNWNRQPL
jgi:(S)-ureidoglycine aminohydrolase